MFSHSLDLSSIFSIRPYTPMGLPFELPLSLKKMNFPLPNQSYTNQTAFLHWKKLTRTIMLFKV